jgi:small subunit ribosomal protein S6
LHDYELTVIISPEVTDEELPSAVEKVSQFITQRGGAVTEVNQVGRRKLSYPINRFVEGSYILTLFKLEPKFISELERDLGMSQEILRHLVVRAGK